MTTTDTTVNNLIINTMTQAQYSQITPDPNQLYMVTDSTITSSDVTNALGYTPTTPANVDGQWVFSSKSLSTSGAKGSTSFNLSSATYNNYLPSDNYCYEVLLSFYGANTSSTKAIAKFTFGGQETNAVAAINSGSMCTLNGIFPLDSTHTFTLAVTGKDFSTLNLDVLGYRRLGTNS